MESTAVSIRMKPIRPGTRNWVELELGVVEDARARVEAAGALQAGRGAVRDQACVGLGRRSRARSRARWWRWWRRRRRAGTAPARCALGERARVALGDHQHRPRHAPLGDRREVAAGRRRRDLVEVGRVHEGGHQLAAARALVEVLHGEAHVAHVEVDRVAVEHQHEGRQAEQHPQAERVAARSGAAPCAIAATCAGSRPPWPPAALLGLDVVDEDVFERRQDLFSRWPERAGRLQGLRDAPPSRLGVRDHHVDARAEDGGLERPGSRSRRSCASRMRGTATSSTRAAGEDAP